MRQQAKQIFEVEISSERVWDFLWDVQTLAQCIPGCGPVEIIEEQKAYKAMMKRRVGPILLRFALEINVLEANAPKEIFVKILGADKYLKTTIKQDLKINLIPIGDNKTQVNIDLDVEMSGVLVSLGKRLAVAHIDQILKDFVATMQERIKKKGT